MTAKAKKAQPTQVKQVILVMSPAAAKALEAIMRVILDEYDDPRGHYAAIQKELAHQLSSKEEK